MVASIGRRNTLAESVYWRREVQRFPRLFVELMRPLVCRNRTLGASKSPLIAHLPHQQIDRLSTSRMPDCPKNHPSSTQGVASSRSEATMASGISLAWSSLSAELMVWAWPVRKPVISRSGSSSIGAPCSPGRLCQRRVKTPRIGRLKIPQGAGRWLASTNDLFSRRSDVARAIDCMLNHWDPFTRFLEEWRTCLKNNAAERAFRAIALERKS